MKLSSARRVSFRVHGHTGGRSTAPSVWMFLQEESKIGGLILLHWSLSDQSVYYTIAQEPWWKELAGHTLCWCILYVYHWIYFLIGLWIFGVSFGLRFEVLIVETMLMFVLWVVMQCGLTGARYYSFSLRLSDSWIFLLLRCPCNINQEDDYCKDTHCICTLCTEGVWMFQIIVYEGVGSHLKYLLLFYR
jgi:hypothetical protein